MIYDCRMLTQEPRKPNHNFCNSVLRTFRTWSVAAKFNVFPLAFNSGAGERWHFPLFQQPPIFVKTSLFFTIKLSHFLPAFESLPNQVMVVDSLLQQELEKQAYFWHNSKESTCQCKRCRFNPWVGKFPWSQEMVTHCSILAWKILQTTEPGGL